MGSTGNRYAPEFKAQILEEYTTTAASIKALSRKYGVSKGALSKWLEALPKKTQDFSAEGLKQRHLRRSATHLSRLLSADSQHLKYEALRIKVIVEQDFKCLHCQAQDWMGQPLSLELDHINGDNKNNQRENLRALCPNCHSITPTWRGRNDKKRTRRQTTLEFYKLSAEKPTGEAHA